jgi:glutathione S-transferase
MLKLYFAPFACSMAVKLALLEAGLPHEQEKVSLRDHKTASGADFYGINPRGAVPVLELEPGVVLTEVAVILQYIADQKPDAALAPAFGTLARYRLMETLNFIATELHKGFSPLWRKPPEDQRNAVVATLNQRLAILDRRLAGHAFVLGDRFTVADAYLFVMLQWAEVLAVDLSAHANLAAYKKRLDARPTVVATLAAQA